MKKLGLLLSLLLIASCAAKAPANSAPAAGGARDVLVTKHDPASGKPDTSAVEVQPGIVVHLYAVNGTQGRFHVVVGSDVRDITLGQGASVTLTFGTRTLNMTLKSVNAQGAQLRVEAKGTA